MADLSGIPTPSIDWESSNLPESWKKFVCHVNLIFQGPLKDKDEDVKAHAPLSFLYSVDLRNFNEKECHQMSVFLNQLTSNPIGFTALGLFTIDRSTIITFAGSIVTYAVVVVQLKP